MQDNATEVAGRYNRRRFLRNSSLLAGLSAVPWMVPSSVFGAFAPSNRIQVACIGTGNQGIGILRRFIKNDDVQIVAVCDVNRGSYGYKSDDQFPDGRIRVDQLGAHVRNSLDCVRSRQDPVAPVEIGHRSATVCHLGNVAIRLGKDLRWDPQAERFLNDDEANAMLTRAMRDPWTL